MVYFSSEPQFSSGLAILKKKTTPQQLVCVASRTSRTEDCVWQHLNTTLGAQISSVNANYLSPAYR